MKFYDKNLNEIDLTEQILHLEKRKKEIAKELSKEHVFHMIWHYGNPDGKIDPVSGRPEVVGHIEKRDVDVEDIFSMFPEINPVFFKNFNLNEFTFRFKGGTVTFIRKDS